VSRGFAVVLRILWFLAVSGKSLSQWQTRRGCGSPEFGQVATFERTTGLHFGDPPSRATPEDLRSCRGRGQKTRAQRESLFVTSRDHIIESGGAWRDGDGISAAHFDNFAAARGTLIERIRSTTADEHIKT
jgi:hypothetical protein